MKREKEMPNRIFQLLKPVVKTFSLPLLICISVKHIYFWKQELKFRQYLSFIFLRVLVLNI
jgi:hypothetical protein